MSSGEYRWEPSERWVRGRIGDTTVVDSRHPRLVWAPGVPVPAYVFPRGEVRADLLTPAADPPTDTAGTYYDLTVGGRTLANAAWTYPVDELADTVGFAWAERAGEGVEHWYEEDEEIFVHPRDPHKRVDVLPSSRHVVVEVDGDVLADTRHPVLLFETGLPIRYYLPAADVRRDLLTPSPTHTGCPYKGVASYWSVRVGGREITNLVWSYPDPTPNTAAIRDLYCFYNEDVDLVVDGERLPRPRTGFHRPALPH
ncbi:DUF427 domain-containing protein [Actinocatenispora rupis]|nr:DUF427 domain-containing protein [Actinocatenispora rupis]